MVRCVPTAASSHNYSAEQSQALRYGMEKEDRIARRFMPKILKRYRELAGMSQQALADSVGVSKGFVSALEGGRSVPNLDMLVLLAAALNIRPGVLVDSMVEEAEKTLR